jgi:hypothetical protein
VGRDDSSAAEGLENRASKISTRVFEEYKDQDGFAPFAFYSSLFGFPGSSYDNLERLLKRAPIDSKYGNKDDNMFEYIVSYFREVRPPTLKFPLRDKEASAIEKELDAQSGGFVSRYNSEIWTPRKERRLSWRTVGGASCIHEVVEGRQWASEGYSYTPLAPIQYFGGWQVVISRLRRELRRVDAELYARMLKASATNDALKLLLQKKMGSLSAIIEFTPLDPMSLLRDLPHPETDFEAARTRRAEVDKRILAIRGQMANCRSKIEKLVEKCLQSEVRDAVDAVQSIEDDYVSRDVTQKIINQLGEFSKKRLVESIEKKIDSEMSKKQKIVHATNLLGDIRLMASGLTLTAASLGLTTELDGALAGISVLGSGVIAKCLRSQLHHLPGFDIYAAFQDWPKS